MYDYSIIMGISVKEQLHFNDNSLLRIWRLETILERGRATVLLYNFDRLGLLGRSCTYVVQNNYNIIITIIITILITIIVITIYIIVIVIIIPLGHSWLFS
jgi:hypothetical protein